MRRDEAIDGTRSILDRAGFSVSRPLNLRSISFDIVARRDDKLLIVKVLTNVDALSRENAEEMKVLAEALGASPLMVGERSGSGTLEDGIVYSRFSIPIISLATLADHVLYDSPPLIFAAPGGLYVKLDSELLHMVRTERGISLGTLAEIAGVSRRTIQMYESGMGAMIDAALRLEDYLDVPIVVPVDPLAYPFDPVDWKQSAVETDPFTSAIFETLMTMGATILPTVRSPFDALTRSHEMLFLTGLGKDESRLKSKAIVVRDISRITGNQAVIFVDRMRSRENLEGTALVGRDELRSMSDPDAFLKVVLERSATDD